jgi:hypothetical protein
VTIEKLTEEERAALRSQREWPDLEDIDKALRIIDAHAAERAALVERAERAEELLARAQDGRRMTPREANTHSVQLDYDIGQHLQRSGWAWDAVNRVWRRL